MMGFYYIVLIIIELYLFFHITKSFAGCRLFPALCDFIFLPLYTVICAIVLPLGSYLFPFMDGIVETATFMLLFFVYTIVAYRKNPLQERLLLYMLSMFFFLAASFLASFLRHIGIFPDSITDSMLFQPLVMLFLAIPLLRIPTICRIYPILCRSALPLKLAVSNSWLIACLLFLISKREYVPVHSNALLAFCTVLVLLLVDACTLYYDQRNQNDRRQLESYQQNLPIYESLITEIRSKQHEYTNRIQALSSLGHTCGDYDELLDALDRYAKEYSSPLQAYPLLLIDKPLLAASLYSLASRSESNDISIQFVVDSTEIRSSATEVQMADLTGALLQNAIEASRPGDHIHVRMRSDGERLDFEVRNPVPALLSQEEVNQFFQLGYSTKNRDSDDKSPHGLGLHQVSTLCNKLGGQITASCVSESYNGKENITYFVIMKIVV